jgi:hypothetical protein
VPCTARAHVDQASVWLRGLIVAICADLERPAQV